MPSNVAKKCQPGTVILALLRLPYDVTGVLQCLDTWECIRELLLLRCPEWVIVRHRKADETQTSPVLISVSMLSLFIRHTLTGLPELL